MIKAEDLRELLYEYFKRREVLEYCFNDIKGDIEPSEENIKRRQYHAKIMLKDGAKIGGKKLTPAEIEDYTRLKNKRSAKKLLEETYGNICELEKRLYGILETEEYDRYLKHIIFNEPLEDVAEQLRQTVQGEFSSMMYALYRHVFRYCFYENSGIEDAHFKGVMNSIIYVGALGSKDLTDYLKDNKLENPLLELFNGVGENEETLNEILGVYNDINNRVEKLADEEEEQDQQAEQPATEEQGAGRNREIIPRIAYDTEMQIAHSEYISSLIKNGFKLDKKVFDKSEETLNRLQSEDNDILDLLILNWYAQGVRRFTDRQIAVALWHDGDSNANVSADDLRKINESIERLRKTDIKKGIESIEEIDSSKLRVTETTTLISVIIREIEHNGNTTVYDFTGVQGYDEYAQITKKTSKYKNALISADIKGIQHDFKNDTLKRLLVRRITGLSFRKHTAIDMREVYEVLEITDPKNYTYAKKKVKTMLEELRNSKNDVYYNFSYAVSKRNKATIITFTASTSAPLEVDKTKKEKDF